MSDGGLPMLSARSARLLLIPSSMPWRMKTPGSGGMPRKPSGRSVTEGHFPPWPIWHWRTMTGGPRGGEKGDGEDPIKGDGDMRIIAILCMMALAALAIPGAAEFPPSAPSGCTVSGTFVPEEKGYFKDFQISLSVEGVRADAFDDQVSQVRASRHYHLLEVVPGATEVRVSGSASRIKW